MSPAPLKIYFHAMDGSGHLNACVGLAQSLKARGHSILFLLNAAFKGQFAKFGFEEHLLERAKVQGQTGSDSDPVPLEQVNPVKAFAKMILEMGLLNGKSPLEKMKENHDESFAESLFHSTKDFNPQLASIIASGRPDLIILDHFLVPPAILACKIPWLFLLSGNPLPIIASDDLPPMSSGYPTNSDRALWAEFREVTGFRDGFIKYQEKLFKEFGYEAGPEDYPSPNSVFPSCKYGYIYGYPEELDYQDVVPIPEKFIRVDAFCRDIPEPFELPKGFRKPGEKLIYFSLGSMGSVDVPLVKKVTEILSKTPYKTIVSKGPLADEYELPANCWGQGYLPQTRVLPLVDLVITHGGNNTLTETFSFGLPMIVLPLFGDQYDNAQRITEKGFGRRLEPYNFKETELLTALQELLHDEKLKERLQKAKKRIAASKSKEKACEKIETLVEKLKK